ncbi:MAG: pantoate--beta-alanine ligase [Gammaproteobacteria bacterium]|nr:pantoate--beta-alanine ligase [Gammaproteobacteria bacterium]
MQIIHTISELRHIIAGHKQAGKVIGFVPTMGNLHQGHLQLLAMALSKTDIVVCSIFVNPLQFAEGEDFAQYPRTLDADTKKLQQAGCDIVFAPAMDEIYPASGGHDSECHGRCQSQSQVIVPGISTILEGVSRPSHFIGVATVVAKLFNMVQPDKAVFGEKDYQQLQVIKRFVEDLCFPVEILSHPVVREASGLAMSSRNAYLSQLQIQQAAKIYQTLQLLVTRIHDGARDYVCLEQEAVTRLNGQGFVTDYIKIQASDLTEPTAEDKKLVILAAAHLGSTRLIDNIQLTL